MSALKLLSPCPRTDCCIEQIDYYRCTACGNDFIVKSGEDWDGATAPDATQILVQAAMGWVTSPPS